MLAFHELEYCHTGSVIYSTIMSVLEEYEIIDKLFSISFHNALANTTEIDMFLQNISTLTPSHSSKNVYVRCVCHIINLIVQVGMTYMNYYLEQN